MSNKKSQNNQKNKQQEKYDTIFIRHAQSHFNQGTLSYVEQYELYDLTWLDLVDKNQFNDAVTYNPDFIDANITEKGKQQCRNAKQLFDPSQVDLIIVSPQKRALQTCRQIFGDHKNVIVHPLATQVFRYSCDVSQPMHLKINQFKGYNFEEMKNWSNEWFLQVLSQQKRKYCQNYFKQNQIQDFKQRQHAAVELLSKGIISQTAQQLRQRVMKLKQLIRDLRTNHKANKVAVVSHHYTTQCLLAPQFYQDGNVKGIGTIENGRPYFRLFEDIIKIK